ncbi:MAG: hypothetical protein ACRC8Y_00795, partial [Chroococcales cyanobacterium]
PSLQTIVLALKSSCCYFIHPFLLPFVEVPLLESSIEVLGFSVTKLLGVRGDRSSKLQISATGALLNPG